MYTEEDLRDTFRALEREAPDVTGVLAALARARRRRTVRRRAVGVLAAASVAVVVAGGAALVGDLTGPSGPRPAMPPAALHLNALEYPFAVDESTGLEVDYRDARFVGASTADVGTGGTGPVRYPYRLDVLQTGRYVPPRGQAGEPVQVNGMRGFYFPDFTYGYPENRSEGVPGVAWEYAQDSWATVRYQPEAPRSVPPADVRETMLRIASAVRFDRTTPLRLPFRIGYLPAGLQPPEGFPADMGAGPNNINAGFSLTSPAGWLSFYLVAPVGGPPPVGEPTVQHTSYDTVKVVANLGQFTVQVEGGGYPPDEVKRVAQSITPADLHDESTWIDAEQALPLH
jgi:hypothetical protein